MTPFNPEHPLDSPSKATTARIGFDPPQHRSGRGLAALQRLLRGAPPKRKRRRRDLRVNTLLRFARVHREAADRLDTYTWRRDQRYRRLGGYTSAERGERAAHYMYANNEHSRITLARLLLEEMRRALAVTDEPFSFVTVVPVEYLLAVEDAAAMSAGERQALVRRLQFLVRQTLQRMNYIAMVEPALYKRRGPDGVGDNRDGLFWHAHAVVWGRETQAVRAEARANIGNHRNLFGRRAVWVKAIEPSEVDVYSLYLVKAPLKHYDFQPTTKEFVDPETGEVFTGTGYRQRPDIMETGDRVRVANAMEGLLLDQLLFGGGAGRDIVKSVRDRVLARWRMEERLWSERQTRNRTMTVARSPVDQA